MKKRTFALLLAAVMACSALAGCGGGNAAPETTQPSAGPQTPDAQGTQPAEKQEIQLHWAAANFYSFDNNANYAAEEIQVQSHVLEGLVRPTTDEAGNQILAPAGAERWDVSDDGLTYTFHLREYYWSDGVQVTAQHFVDSFRRIGDPRNAFDFASFIGDIVGLSLIHI
mgnify:FL=1